MEWFRPTDRINAAHRVRNAMPLINPRFSYAVTDAEEDDCSTGLITGQAIRFLETHDAEPFALWVSYPDPHEPYVAPRRFAEMFPPDQIPLPPQRDDEMRDAPDRNRILHRILGVENDREIDVRSAIATYHAMARAVDDGVGRIMDALERLNLSEQTIVVFCADHGDFAGEHRMFVKGGVFYDCLVRIPMIVSWPAHIQSGLVDSSMVSLVDVVPTLLQLQGLRELELMQGQPLPTITSALPRSAAFAEYGAGGPAFTDDTLDALAPLEGRRALMASLQTREAEGRRKMVRTQGWKYVHDPMGDLDELYDLNADPWELSNLINDPPSPSVVDELQRLLLDWSISTEDGLKVPLPQPITT